MSNEGKIGGGILGAIIGGPVGAVAGAFLGSIFDEDSTNTNSSRDTQVHPEALFLFQENKEVGVQCPGCHETVILSSPGVDWNCPHCSDIFRAAITCPLLNNGDGKSIVNARIANVLHFNILGLIAKSDGHVSEEEIEEAVSLMRELNLDEEFVETAKQSFRSGAEEEINFPYYAFTLGQMFTHQPENRMSFVADYIHLACSDGVFDDHERDIIRSISVEAFGFNSTGTENYINQISSEYQSTHGVQNSELTSALATLGCTIDDSFDIIKSSYKKLCKKFHPDTISSKDLPGEFVTFATEKFKEIQNAYELVEISFSSKAA